MKVKITIEEHISQDFEVEVTEEAFKQSNCKTVMEYAMRISERKYKDGSFVLDNSEVVNKIMPCSEKASKLFRNKSKPSAATYGHSSKTAGSACAITAIIMLNK